MGGRADRYFIPALVGVAPAVMALASSRPDAHGMLMSLILVDALPVFVAELVVIVVALREGLIGWLRDNGPPRLAAIALAVWVAIAVGTVALVSPDPFSAGRWTMHWFVHVPFGFAIAFLCSRMLRVRDFTSCFLVGFLLYALVILAFVLRYWGQPINWVRDFAGVTHIRHVGYYAAAMTAVAIAAMAVANCRRSWVLAFAVATTGFAIGLWTGSRGMALSVAGATAAGMLLLPEMRRPGAWGAAIVALCIAIALVAWLPVPNANMMGVARTVTATTEHEVTTGRITIWLNVMHAIARHPVFGYGPGQMTIVAHYNTMAQPHNFILQILLDWGLAGFACFIVMAFYYGLRVWPRLRSASSELAVPFMGAASILLLSMIDASMFYVLPVAIFAACAGMMAADEQPNGGSRQATS